jgi:UDP-N-acetyl-D-glucosamine dehydrogenase
VLLVTDHSAVDYAMVVENSKLIVDTRNKLKNFPGNHIVRI